MFVGFGLLFVLVLAQKLDGCLPSGDCKKAAFYGEIFGEQKEGTSTAHPPRSKLLPGLPSLGHIWQPPWK